MKRISLKIRNQNDWLIDAISKEQKENNRPSFQNTIETILVDHFKKVKK